MKKEITSMFGLHKKENKQTNLKSKIRKVEDHHNVEPIEFKTLGKYKKVVFNFFLLFCLPINTYLCFM
jgi:hypothetical protein